MGDTMGWWRESGEGLGNMVLFLMGRIRNIELVVLDFDHGLVYLSGKISS